jgi:hypothetical protein
VLRELKAVSVSQRNNDPKSNDGLAAARVELVEGCGEWFARVVEGGTEHMFTFGLESFALAYAEGQRLRLKLGEVVRI